MYIKGLMNPSIGGYLPRHIKVVVAFIIDIIRVMNLAFDRKISGRLESINSFSFKHPHIQPLSDFIAKKWVAEFIKNERDR